MTEFIYGIGCPFDDPLPPIPEWGLCKAVPADISFGIITNPHKETYETICKKLDRAGVDYSHYRRKMKLYASRGLLSLLVYTEREEHPLFEESPLMFPKQIIELSFHRYPRNRGYRMKNISGTMEFSTRGEKWRSGHYVRLDNPCPL